MMKEFSPNGNRRKPKKERFLPFSKENLSYFVEDYLAVKDIEMQETENNIIFQMRFKGGGSKIIELLDNFYQENETKIQQSLRVEDFGIILDGDRKEFVAQIVLPKDISEEDKQIARNILEELKQKLLSA
jgi:hypothetical protein